MNSFSPSREQADLRRLSGKQSPMHGLEYPPVNHGVNLEGCDVFESFRRRPRGCENHGVLLDMVGSLPSHDDERLQAGSMHAQEHCRTCWPILKLKPVIRGGIEGAKHGHSSLNAWGLDSQAATGFDDSSNGCSQIGLALYGGHITGKAVRERQFESRQSSKDAGRGRRRSAAVRAIYAEDQVCGVQRRHLSRAAASFGSLDHSSFTDFAGHMVNNAASTAVYSSQCIYQGREARHSSHPSDARGPIQSASYAETGPVSSYIGVAVATGERA